MKYGSIQRLRKNTHCHALSLFFGADDAASNLHPSSIDRNFIAAVPQQSLIQHANSFERPIPIPVQNVNAGFFLVLHSSFTVKNSTLLAAMQSERGPCHFVRMATSAASTDDQLQGR